MATQTTFDVLRRSSGILSVISCTIHRWEEGREGRWLSDIPSKLPYNRMSRYPVSGLMIRSGATRSRMGPNECRFVSLARKNAREEINSLFVILEALLSRRCLQ